MYTTTKAPWPNEEQKPYFLTQYYMLITVLVPAILRRHNFVVTIIIGFLKWLEIFSILITTATIKLITLVKRLSDDCIIFVIFMT